ncbi:MAG: undecaprenyldiphospho-muramoylpentapeptide beta-N-acetylglucosaminyltransferase [Nitrosomonas sp.]|nr:undecaprenyldiphospho-muramoylpentapeptide beta-N-acetylglucosaminyltransferase [Nitrosomonas sp.]
MTRTILIMAGGTGGHVFPGLAVANYLKTAGWHVVWLGTQSGMEARLVPQHNIDMKTIDFSGLRGKGAMTWLTLPLRLLRAFWQSIKVLREVKPNVVLGMGGYPAFPGGMMASLMNKSLLIHEQNSVPGLTNKVLAKLADKVLLGFPGAIKNSKATFSGNPVREEISQLGVPEERFQHREGKLKLLVIGGSLGAQVLNTVVPEALKLLPQAKRPSVIHQAGAKHLEILKKNYGDLVEDVELVDFIDDMAACYADCDLVICRAGALTISELAAVGVASILVPYPYAVDDHQTKNAEFLSKSNAAFLLPQNELTAKKLEDILLKNTREDLLGMAKAARMLAKPDATQLVAQTCIEMSEA